MSNTLLQIDSSARINGSLSREVTQYLAQQLMAKKAKNTTLDEKPQRIYRDLLNTELPFLSEEHIGAYFTKADARNEEQEELLSVSNTLVNELKAADELIIGAPMYNFSVSASLKAWVDLICRVGETFVYGSNGPEGLLNIKRAFIVVAAGGTAVGSDVDFASPFLQQICKFIGIDEVHIIDVSGSKRDPDTLVDAAKQQIDTVLTALEE